MKMKDKKEKFIETIKSYARRDAAKKFDHERLFTLPSPEINEKFSMVVELISLDGGFGG